MIEKLIGTWAPDFERWEKGADVKSDAVGPARALVLSDLEVELTDAELHIRNYGRKTQQFTYEVAEERGNTVTLAVTMQPSGRQGTYEATLEGEDTLILRLTAPKTDFMALKRA